MAKSDVVLEVIGNHNGQKILGKKRLQKLIFLLIASGEEDHFGDFEIYKFGPYSRTLSHKVADMAYRGRIREEVVEYGDFKNSMSSYAVKNDFESNDNLISIAEKIKKLTEFGTLTLEIASTFAYFVGIGHLSLEDAINETKNLKPKKTNQLTISESKRILNILSIT